MAKARIALPAELREVRWGSPDGKTRGHFKPNGKPRVLASSRLLTPNWRSKDAPWAARLLVGFNVGEIPTYEMEDLIALVRRVREKQGAPLDSSFVYQKGIYTHHDGHGVVTEDGAQVIILNLDPGTSREVFEAQMIELANVIVGEMGQETVIVEMQRGGVVQETIGVTEVDTELEVAVDD